MNHFEKVRSPLTGIALGDALGLPYEGLSAQKVARRLAGKPLKPALLPGLMMVSDDTDHACMALGAWRDCGGDAEKFSKILGHRFRWWFAALPPGVGMATAKSAIRLWLGWNPAKSGVHSAGNGPLMRAGILGVVIEDAATRRIIVDRSTRLTHTDERSVDAARILAEACTILGKAGPPVDVADFCAKLSYLSTTPEIQRILAALATPPDAGCSIAEYLHVHVLGRGFSKPHRGVTGYAPESLAAALTAFLYGGKDGLAVIRTAIDFGGDTDSVASFAGCLMGAADPEAFSDFESKRLLRALVDLPWNGATLDALASGRSPSAVLLALRPLRNLAQLIVVIVHGLLRLVAY